MSQELRKKCIFHYSGLPETRDPVNRRIIEELHNNPRLTMSELGRRVGMSSPGITERVRRLEDIGVIQGYRLDVSPMSLGLPIAVYVRIRPNSGQLAKIAELAQQIPEVVECYRVTGEDCFILKAFIPSIDQLDCLLDPFLLYGSTTTTIIQSTIVPLRSLPLSAVPDDFSHS